MSCIICFTNPAVNPARKQNWCQNCFDDSRRATQGTVLCGVPNCPNAAYYDSFRNILHVGCGKTHSLFCKQKGITENR